MGQSLLNDCNYCGCRPYFGMDTSGRGIIRCCVCTPFRQATEGIENVDLYPFDNTRESRLESIARWNKDNPLPVIKKEEKWKTKLTS